MKALSPETAALLQAYRHEIVPTARTDARSWNAIEQRISAGDTLDYDDIDSGENTGPRKAAWIVAAAALVPLAAAAVALVVVRFEPVRGTREHTSGTEAAALRANDNDPAQRARSRTRKRGAAAARRGAARNPAADFEPEDVIRISEDPAERALAAEPEPPKPIKRSSAARKAKRSAAQASEPVPSSLAAEAQALGRARAALRDGQPKRALRHLGAHARNYPDGVLAPERTLLEIRANCEAGRVRKSQQLLRTFRRKYPNSPIAKQPGSACER